MIHVYMAACLNSRPSIERPLLWEATSNQRPTFACTDVIIIKGTKALTLGAVGMYTPVFSLFHGLPTYTCVRSWVYIIIEYTYMHVHEKYACSTDMQLPATVNTWASYIGRECFWKTRTTYSPFVLLLQSPPCSKRAESGRGKPCSFAYWLVYLVFMP